MTIGKHRPIGLFFLGLGLVSLGAAQPTMPRASYVLPSTVREWQARGVPVTFIDVRQPVEFEAGHLEGALNIPHDQIERRSAEIAKDHPHVVYCIHSSWRAPYAANALADLGYRNIHILDGGVSAWNAGGQTLHATTPGRKALVAAYPADLSRLLDHPSDWTVDGRLELTLDELRAYDGMDGRPAYVALRGVVYDVTRSRLWRGGEHDPSHGKALAGHDLTPVLNEAPHGGENLERFPVVGRIVAAPRGVAGVLTADTTWSTADGPIIVSGDVTVAAGATLTIEAGVEVRFDGNHTLTVHGTLNSLGLPGNEIVWVVGGERVLVLDTPTLVAKRRETRVTPPTAVVATALAFDATTGEIRYTLPEPARVRARIGIREGGPLLVTLIDWEPRSAGPHVEIWDGRDGSGSVDFGERDDLLLVLACLPEHADGVFPATIRGRRNAPRLTITFPETTEIDDAGLPVLRGSRPVRVTINAEDYDWLKRMSFELGLYVDTVLLIEHEEGANPFDYLLDTTGLSTGPHSMTVNVIGYEGEIGTESVRIFVDNRAQE